MVFLPQIIKRSTAHKTLTYTNIVLVLEHFVLSSIVFNINGILFLDLT